MAWEIHDTLAQGLSAVVAQLEVALTCGKSEGWWRGRVRLARNTAREGLSEARHSVWALTPVLLDGATLSEALRELAGKRREQTGVQVSCHIDEEMPPLPAEVQAALLRVAQSALANVAEHAGASCARLTFSEVDGAVRLDVWDDGAGFDPARITSGGQGHRGFGVTAMRQRLGQFGGRLEIESAPGAGSVICASIPLARSTRPWRPDE